MWNTLMAGLNQLLVNSNTLDETPNYKSHNNKRSRVDNYLTYKTSTMNQNKLAIGKTMSMFLPSLLIGSYLFLYSSTFDYHLIKTKEDELLWPRQ